MKVNWRLSDRDIFNHLLFCHSLSWNFTTLDWGPERLRMSLQVLERPFVSVEIKVTKKKQCAQRWSHSAHGQTKNQGLPKWIMKSSMSSSHVYCCPNSHHPPHTALQVPVPCLGSMLLLIATATLGDLGGRAGIVLWGFSSKIISLLLLGDSKAVFFFLLDSYTLAAHSQNFCSSYKCCFDTSAEMQTS